MPFVSEQSRTIKEMFHIPARKVPSTKKRRSKSSQIFSYHRESVPGFITLRVYSRRHICIAEQGRTQALY